MNKGQIPSNDWLYSVDEVPRSVQSKSTPGKMFTMFSKSRSIESEPFTCAITDVFSVLPESRRVTELIDYTNTEEDSSLAAPLYLHLLQSTSIKSSNVTKLLSLRDYSYYNLGSHQKVTTALLKTM